MADYRNTKYCPSLDKLAENKGILLSLIQKDHRRAKDMYPLVSNRNKYKEQFARVYNCKCAYCGVSIELIPMDSFEVDHIRYKKSFKKATEAGSINNLALACHNCNRKKSDFPISDGYMQLLHPDIDLHACFVRDDLYSIRISEDKEGDETIKGFYEQLRLEDEVHRLDYLLMNMIGLSHKLADKPEIKLVLTDAIEILRTKRNIV